MDESRSVSEAIISVLRYFSLFEYPPSEEELFTYLALKTTRSRLKSELMTLVHSGKVVEKDIRTADKEKKVEKRYALRSSEHFFSQFQRRRRTAQAKVGQARRFAGLVKHFPQIQMIALSGSLSMDVAGKKDDIDICIISARGRMWTARFLCLAVAQLIGKRRKRGLKNAPDAYCFNLFFDGRDMRVPKSKRSLYVAHEALQMRPLAVRGRVYTDFLKANTWVQGYLPNGYNEALKYVSTNANHAPKMSLSVLGHVIENILRSLQLRYMQKHITHELITENQLWFFPNDFHQTISKKLSTKG